MNSVNIQLLFLGTLIAISAAPAKGEGTCNACNCQFNNVQVLTELIRAEIASIVTNVSESDGGTGVAYTRWGKSTCPTGTGAQLVYSGRAGGTHYTSRGGAAEKICLPENPDYLAGTAEFSGFVSVVHGAEYEVQLGPNANLNEQNVPCAVCYVPVRAAALVIPAKTVCPTSWTREYHGYLMTERDPHYRSSYNCIDINAEGIQGSSTNMNGALFYYTYTMCNGFDCPPYENRRILSCAVCTK